MAKHIIDTEMGHYPTREAMHQKYDEMQAMFDSTNENIEAIIAFLDEILLNEEVFMCDEST